MDLAFFKRTDDPGVLRPTEIAQSLWAGGQMHGVAISSALARYAEGALTHRADLRPVRMTVDLFRAVPLADCTFATTVVREGPRIALVDVELTQDGVPMARASFAFLKATQSPSGVVWHSGERPSPPPLDQVPASEEPRVPFFKSDAPWSDNFGHHQNAGRKQTWQTALPTVLGEVPSPFQAVAGIADSTSLVTNWGDKGVEFINADVTLTLARPACGLEVGLEAVDHVESDGIAIGTATVFDRQGVLGTSLTTSIVNSRGNVDFQGVEYDEHGNRVD